MRSTPYLLSLFILGCSQPEAPKAPAPPADSWSNEAEELFQNAEALKYAVEQHNLERQRLEANGVEGDAPLLPYRRPTTPDN